MKYEKILVLAPHTDDGELGCGATISKYLREGKQVYYVAFSACDQSLPEGLPNGTLKKELFNAAYTLGIPEENVTIFNYEVRNFATHRQEILDDMIILGKKLQPDVVFMPSINDIHQDHYTISIEGLRAFKKITILCYELPWNNFTFNNQAFSCVEEQDVRNKIAAIKCYKSQEMRAYTTEEYTKSLLKMHGIQVGVDFAEVFEIPRLIL
jgi:LmbE family N-acetylglucosaminyl deacetylase